MAPCRVLHHPWGLKMAQNGCFLLKKWLKKRVFLLKMAQKKGVFAQNGSKRVHGGPAGCTVGQQGARWASRVPRVSMVPYGGPGCPWCHMVVQGVPGCRMVVQGVPGCRMVVQGAVWLSRVPYGKGPTHGGMYPPPVCLADSKMVDFE